MFCAHCLIIVLAVRLRLPGSELSTYLCDLIATATMVVVSLLFSLLLAFSQLMQARALCCRTGRNLV